MKELFRLFRYIKRHWTNVIFNILSNLMFVFFSFFSLTLIVPFVRNIFGMSKPVPKPESFELSSDSIINNFNYFIGSVSKEYGVFRALIVVAVAFIIFSFLSNLFRYLGMYFLAPIRNGVIRDIRNDVYNKLLILPLSFFSEQRRGDILSRVTVDVGEIEWSIVSSLQMMVKDPLNILVFFTALIILSPQLVLFVLIVLPVTGFIISRVGKSLKRNSEKGQRKLGRLLSMLEETISGLRIIKAFNFINGAYTRFDKANQDYSKVMTKVYRRRDLANPATEILSIVSLVLIIWFGGNLVIEKKLEADTLILFIIVFARMIPPAQSFAGAFYNLQKGRAALGRINEILDAEEVILEKENAVELKDFQHEICFENVHFSYRSDEQNQPIEVLSNVSFPVKKGKTVALVGSSGAGKTTLVDLLPRFYDVDKGRILIDGIDIRNIKINDLRGIMGIVSQETILFNDTVLNNIAFGQRNISEERVREAARIANAEEFILKLDQGYHTHIGDRGLKLSGGQRQRISIARAVLKNPPIMILDEATSALDTESEKLVQEALTQLMKNRTSIVIAHRLSTIYQADEILVLDKGKIVEQGKHQELMQQNGIYRKLVDMQSFS